MLEFKDICAWNGFLELTDLVTGGPLSNMLSLHVDPTEQWNGLTKSMTNSGFARCRLARVVYSRVNFFVLDVVDRHVTAIRCRCFEVNSAENRLLNRSVYCIQEHGENVDMRRKLYIPKKKNAQL